MEEFFGHIYDFINKLRLYCNPLEDYLWGWECASDDYTGVILYNRFGLMAFGLTALSAGIYYYVWKPVRRQRLWWFVLLAGQAILLGLLGYYMVSADGENGLIGDCLLFDDQGQQAIHTADYIGFGVVNAIVTLLLFGFISYCIKWGSRTCKHYPFKYPF